MLTVTLPRSEVFAPRGVVSSVNSLGTSAGFRALTLGGTSIDAVIACAAVLSVTEPQTGGLGGDTFILHYSAADKRVYALNGNGQAPAKATVEFYRQHGRVPANGPLSITVPGTLGAWELALQEWGTLPLKTLLDDAITLARDGFPASHRLTRSMTHSQETYLKYEASRQTFFADGQPPQTGEIFRNERLAESLSEVAELGSGSFYRGALARRICDGLREVGGILEPEDFAAYSPQMREPLQIDYEGWTIFGQPLPSQSLITLAALGIVERAKLWPREFGHPDTTHTFIEAIKLAFDDRYRYLGDPDFVDVPVNLMLSDEHLHAQAAKIDLRQACRPAEEPEGGIPTMDTTCMSAADSFGNMTVYIHSLFAGSGVVAGDTGILMNNRMVSFGINPEQPNCVAPGKRPVHTLSTWIARGTDGQTIAGGMPGGDKQVQGNFQMLTNLLALGADLQAAAAAPRWFIGHGMKVEMEDPLGSLLVDDLRQRGHDLKVVPASALSGRVIVQQRDVHGGLRAGQEPRDGGTFTAAW